MKIRVNFNRLFTVKNNTVTAKVRFTIPGVLMGNAGTCLVGIELQGVDLAQLRDQTIWVTQNDGEYTLEGIASGHTNIFDD